MNKHVHLAKPQIEFPNIATLFLTVLVVSCKPKVDTLNNL